MLATRQPYHVSDAAAAAAGAAIANGGAVARESVRAMRRTTLELESQLAADEFSRDFVRVESGAAANFLLIEALNGDGAALYERLLRCGVVTRFFGKQVRRKKNKNKTKNKKAKGDNFLERF